MRRHAEWLVLLSACFYINRMNGSVPTLLIHRPAVCHIKQGYTPAKMLSSRSTEIYNGLSNKHVSNMSFVFEIDFCEELAFWFQSIRVA